MAAKNPGGPFHNKLKPKPKASTTPISKGTTVTVAQVKATGYKPYQQAAKTAMKQATRKVKKSNTAEMKQRKTMNSTARMSAAKKKAGRM